VILQKSLFTAGMLCSQQPCVWTQSTYGTFILQSGRRPQHHIRSLTNVRRTTALPSRADVAWSHRDVSQAHLLPWADAAHLWPIVTNSRWDYPGAVIVLTKCPISVAEFAMPHVPWYRRKHYKHITARRRRFGI